ncbi:hypothetical protein MES5069_110098 [Mesorhizobium escarrei]|uniref:Uncharacterized protein n=1 Tax=Mesorhizobium escarrei TaxID=666018 RepID=A0ABM9DH32_9HYPH|nr:hypothetical protein MES5069_110098 [Mesorhizobium escarrei]
MLILLRLRGIGSDWVQRTSQGHALRDLGRFSLSRGQKPWQRAVHQQLADLTRAPSYFLSMSAGSWLRRASVHSIKTLALPWSAQVSLLSFHKEVGEISMPLFGS